MKSSSKTIIAILYFATLFFSCSQKKVDEVVDDSHAEELNSLELTENQFNATGVKLGNIERRVLSGVLKANGKLDVPPQNLVSVSAPFGGFLLSTEMLQGMQLRKGQRIATMQNQEYIQLQQDYLDNKSQMEFLEAEFHRQEELSKDNVNSKKNLQQARASYYSKLAIVNGLHAKLKMLNIDFASLEGGTFTSVIHLYAPINGFVTEVNFNVGSFVNPTDILFKIVDTRHLHAELIVFEKDITKIKKGQKIIFTLAGSGKERSATVYLIGREITADRTVRVHGHLDVEDEELLPGMYLSARIELGNRTVNAVPDKAIVGFEGKEYIFVLNSHHKLADSTKVTGTDTKNTHFTLVEIKSGLHESGYTEIILPDDFDIKSNQIVVEGAYSLISKVKNTEEL